MKSRCLRGAPRASAEGAPLTWSNGSTSRPRAELQGEISARGGGKKGGKNIKIRSPAPRWEDKTDFKKMEKKKERGEGEEEGENED